MKIFEDSQVRSMKLRNRMFMAPMGTPANPDGSFSDRAIRYYEERAKGGFGLIITAANQVTSKYEPEISNRLETHRSFEQLNFLVRKVQNHGAKLCLQITPGLGRMQLPTSEGRPYAASEVESFWFPDIKCREFSKEDIQHLVKKMGQAAATAKRAEADAVELHGYGGYLMDQFQSELWNKRTDEYGGSLENRMRFSVECIKEVRQAVGPDFPILFKFTPYHGIPGGREMDEGIAMAKMLEEAGVDILHVDVGAYEAWYKAINTVYQPPRVQLDVAAEIKKNVTLPVMSQGKMQDPADTEAALQEGKADYIGLGHGTITDPHWVNKVRRNETYDIVPCIGCNECLYAIFSGKVIRCAVNPHVFAEDDFPINPGDPNKRVLVVGSGPAGIMAAITAAERGMQVELWEKRNELGGLLLAAGGPRFKQDVADYVQYLISKLHRNNVKVSLMKEATPEEVLAGNYDKVIVATGANPIMPPIKGIDESYVVGANDLLTNRRGYGKKVVVVGGGLVGCETACHCADKSDDVTIIEILPEVLMTVHHSKNNDQALRQLMKDCNIKTITDAKVVEFKDNMVVYDKDGKQETIEADTIAIAAGYRSNTSLYEAINNKVDCSIIGDAEVPDNILKAVHHGFHSVRCI